MHSRSTWSWIREMHDSTLHGCAYRLQQQMAGEGVSPGQELLFDELVAELVWRSSRTRRRLGRPCSCELCQEPFPELDY